MVSVTERIGIWWLSPLAKKEVRVERFQSGGSGDFRVEGRELRVLRFQSGGSGVEGSGLRARG